MAFGCGRFRETRGVEIWLEHGEGRVKISDKGKRYSLEGGAWMWVGRKTSDGPLCEILNISLMFTLS